VHLPGLDPVPENEACDVAHPVRVGAEHQVGGSSSTQRDPYPFPVLAGDPGESLAGGRPSGVDFEDLTRFGVGQFDHPDVRQFTFTGVDDLDGQHLVTAGQPPYRTVPFGGVVGR
jgi:hypothetical protein